MGTPLTGKTPANTYDALIKVGDNSPITSNLKVLSDGLPLTVSSTAINITGNATFSANLDATGAVVTVATQTAGDNSTKAASTAYVDAESIGQDLDFSGDSGNGAVILNTETFAVTGTTNQITTTASGTGLALSLPATVHRDLQGNVTGNLTGDVTGDLTGTVTATSTLADGVIGTTQTVSDDSTKVATTAFVQDAIQTVPAGLVFQGTWNATTNTPTLASGTGTTGHFYIVSVAGSTDLDGITDWKVGDWAVFVEQGASDQWEKVDNSSVLDGNGTGGKISKWSGSGDSVTLTNSVITESGSNIGIGVSNPTTALDINGDGTFSGGITVVGSDAQFNHNIILEGSVFHKDDTNTSFGFPADDAIAFTTSGTEKMRIDSVGAMQFGTGTNNGGFLDFDGTSVQINTQRNPNTGVFVDTAKSNASINLVGADGGSYIRFNTASANNTTATEKMRIDNAGAIKFNNYGAGTLVTDASGNITSISGGGQGGPYLPLAGGTLTGNITAVKGIFESSNNQISIIDSDDSQDFRVQVNSGIFNVRDHTNSQTIFKIDANAGSSALHLQSSGATFAGNVFLPDNKYATFGGANNAWELQIGVVGDNAFIEKTATTNGDLYIKNNGSSKGIIFQNGGATALTIDSSQNSTFAGNITFGDGHFIGDDGDDNLLIQGSAGENIIIDSADDIILDADGADIRFKDGGTEFGKISKGGGSDLIINSSIDDKDIFFTGLDGGSAITALTLDMSNGGSATFRDDIDFGGKITQTGTGTNTFAGNVRVNGWIKGASDTNTLFSNTSLGTLLQSPTNSGAGANIYFRNNSGTVFQTFSQSDGSATFAGNLSANVGSFNSPDASESILMNLVANNGNNAATFRTTASGHIFEIRSQNSGTIKIDSSSSTFSGDVSVEDNLYLTDAGTTRAKIQLNASDRDDLDIKAVSLGSNMKFFTVDTERMRIDSGGDLTVMSSYAGGTFPFRVGFGTYASYTPTFVINDSGNVGIGTSAPTRLLQLTAAEPILRFNPTTVSGDYLFHAGDGKLYVTPEATSSPTMTFSSEKVGIGVTSPQYLMHLNGGSTRTDLQMTLSGYGTGTSDGVQFGIQTGGAYMWNFEDTSVYFGTNNTERMRITSGGDVLFGKTTQGLSLSGIEASSSNVLRATRDGGTPVQFNRTGNNGSIVTFYRQTASVGSISVTTSATSYNTSSDYRLKENVVEMTGALDRVAQLKPSRFNFIADSDTTVDGFLAHEVQSVVPEAITGTKDAMKDEEYEKTPAVYKDKVHPAIEEVKDEEGNVTTEAKESWTENVLVTEAVMATRSVEDYQGIDQSKLVPLLVGAIQELRAEIELLKAK